MNLSILIVTWNGDGILKDCLDSLARVYRTAPEIVVVDNANLATTKALVANYANAKYVAAPENLGFAGGNNLGLASCTRANILLLNNDTVIREHSFEPLLEFLETHPKVGIVQGTMNIPGFGLDDCGTMMTLVGIQRHLHRGEPTPGAAASSRPPYQRGDEESTGTTMRQLQNLGRDGLRPVRGRDRARPSHVGTEVLQLPPILKPRRVTAAKGAMMMIRRAALDATGFLFYDHFKSYFEETDFCRRAANAGWETWFVPTPPIDHLCGATSTRFKRDEIWQQYFRNILYSFARNWGWWGRLVMLPAFTFAAFLKSPKNLIAAMRK